MPIEHELGTLIRRMNPYTDGTRGSMHFVSAGLAPVVAPADAARAAAATAAADAAAAAAVFARRAAEAAQAAHQAAAPGAADAAFANLARARAAADTAIAEAERAANAADPFIDLSHIELVIDDFYANYSSADWVFRGQPQTVKRALRITYRYPFKPNGPYATEHVLVGYAGGNGSG